MQHAYIVYRGQEEVEKVFFTQPIGFTPQEAVDDVRESLINHDGYPSDIRVRNEATGFESPQEG